MGARRRLIFLYSLVMGIAPRGILARLLPVVHSLDGVASALEVHGELRRNLPCLGAIARLKPHP